MASLSAVQLRVEMKPIRGRCAGASAAVRCSRCLRQTSLVDRPLKRACDTGPMRDAEWLPPQPATEPPYQPQRSVARRVGGPIAVGLAVLAKWAAKLKFLLVAVKGAKFLTTAASMLVSIVAYAAIWGWQFGVGFVALLFTHEMGHYVQLRREGVKPSGMLFIPFMG